MIHARVQFAQWLKDNHPALFARAIAIAENSTNGLGQMGPPAPSGGSFWDKFQKAALGLGTTYLALKNQRDAKKINIERAKAGQPPIDVATSAPVIRTVVDMSPELTNRLVSSVGGALQMPLILGGLAVVALLFFMRK